MTARICGFLIAAGTASGASAESPIRVRLYNYAGVSQTTLAGATSDAANILLRAGVRVEWAHCRLHRSESPKDAACELPITSLDLQVRILNEEMERRVRATRHQLGYALLAGGSNSIAAVFFHSVLDLERRNLGSRSAILGAAMAHEIGHLLLEQAHHSMSGLLRASWSDNDLKSIAKGQMGFTSRQASLMVEKVSRRKEVGLVDDPRITPGAIQKADRR